MKAGIIGLGRLGLPVAVAMAYRGHDIMGYDISPARMQKESWPHLEAGVDGKTFEECLRESSLRFGSLQEVVRHSELLFVIVQTPHAPEFEGITPLTHKRRDFSYTYLKSAIRDVLKYASKGTIIAIVSTCMPGTIDREIVPIVPEGVYLAHTPFLEAMGRVMSDFLGREFVIVGTSNVLVWRRLRAFFMDITEAPAIMMSVASAEATKVFYNTFITMKTVFANTVMEACHRVPGADCSMVLRTLQKANQRLISPRYLNPGMGDGGACHPRDNIALSWFARTQEMSYDLFGELMVARERQAAWLCDLMLDHNLPLFILGTAFKAESDIETGSAALLCKSILEGWGHKVGTYDPVSMTGEYTDEPHVFLIGANHSIFCDWRFPHGSVVIDPWHAVKAVQKGVKIIWVGT